MNRGIIINHDANKHNNREEGGEREVEIKGGCNVYRWHCLFERESRNNSLGLRRDSNRSSKGWEQGRRGGGGGGWRRGRGGIVRVSVIRSETMPQWIAYGKGHDREPRNPPTLYTHPTIGILPVRPQLSRFAYTTAHSFLLPYLVMQLGNSRNKYVDRAAFGGRSYVAHLCEAGWGTRILLYVDRSYSVRNEKGEKRVKRVGEKELHRKKKENEAREKRCKERKLSAPRSWRQCAQRAFSYCPA